MAQIVLQGNKVLAYGDNCFIMCGNAVLCTTNGNTYPGATVATCATLPADIGSVGYEYHAGVFVPSGPFGKGSGNVAVVCDECKTLRDSGIPLDNMTKIYKHPYIGGGGYGSGAQNSITCPGFVPRIAFISKTNKRKGYEFDEDFADYGAILFDTGYGFSFDMPVGGNIQAFSMLYTKVDGNTMTWYASDSASKQCNTHNVYYEITLLG